MRLYLIVAGISLLLIVSCGKKSISSKIEKSFTDWGKIERSSSETLKVSKRNFKAILRYNSSQNLIGITSFLDSKQYGHHFHFDPEGNIYSYQYLLNDSVNFSYSVESKFLSDSLIERGSPLVDYMKFEESNKISFLFSSFPRKVRTVQVSKDGVKFTELPLKASKIIPLIVEADYDAKNGDMIYIKTTTRNLLSELYGLEIDKVFYDTCVLR